MNKLITTIACLICCIVYTQAQNKDNMLSKKEQSIYGAQNEAYKTIY